MIYSFADEETADIYHGISSKRTRKRLSTALFEKAQMKLDMINRAHLLEDLRIPPNNKLEKLKGDLAGKYSIRINDQYRIVFIWDANSRSASEVKIIDYH